MRESRSCREFMLKINDPDSKANCANCVKWDREIERCKDEPGVARRYEDTPDFQDFKRMMEDSKDILIE